MQLSKELIEKQLNDCKRARDTHLQQAQAASGAVEVLENLLLLINTPEPKVKK